MSLGTVRIREAIPADADAILEIQAENIVPPEKRDPAKGFLVHGFTREHLDSVIADRSEHVLFISDVGDEVGGYALGYDIAKWMELNPEWSGQLELASADPAEFLAWRRTLYLRHIAKRQAAKTLGGLELSLAFSAEALRRQYGWLLGEIIETPVPNEISRKFHEARGFTRIGQIYYPEDETLWGVHVRKVNTK